MARRGQQLKRQSIAQRLLAIHARRLQQHPDVLGAGVGAPYSEKKKQITRKGRRGQPIHWTKLALKVFVREKREPNEAERIPPYVTLKVGKGAGAKTYKFRVDVVTLGEVRQAPGRSLLQAGQTGWPAMRKPLPGCRLLFGIPSSAANGSADLPNRFDPEEFGWLKVGTIGCVAGTEEQPYLLTAGHVTTEIYKSDPQFPTQPEDKCMIGFDGENAMLCPIDAVTRIVPHSPLTTDGRTVDAVAIPFPKQLLQESLPHWPVPSAPDLFWFFGREAYVLVERDGALHKVRGEIEGIYDPHDKTFDNGYTATIPQTVALRFYGPETTIRGDSGALILALRGNKLNLLGFHFRREDPPNLPSFSLAVAACDALLHVGVEPLA